MSDGVNTPFLLKTIEALGYEKVPAYASGNRALMLLEGKAGAYIRDTGGFAKWDCSGPQVRSFTKCLAINDESSHHVFVTRHTRGAPQPVHRLSWRHTAVR